MSYYERKEIYSLEDVLQHVYSKEEFNNKPELRKHIFDGDSIRMTSKRYRVFKLNHKCVKCKIEGRFFAKEKLKGVDSNIYHFNLYGIKNSKEVMLTKDHIVPKSLGGTNSIDNLCCMCVDCNQKKGNKLY